MAKRLSVSITKSNILKMREELEFAQEGYELMEQKREILVLEVMGMLEDFRKQKEEVEKILSSAYKSFKEACIILGRKKIEKAALSSKSHENIKITDKSIMGIVVPVINYNQTKGLFNQYSFQETSYSLDKTIELFSVALRKLARLTQIEITLYRLANELKKTQRRANALNNLFIPEYKETIKYIEDSLEEKEREQHFQLKRIKTLSNKN